MSEVKLLREFGYNLNNLLKDSWMTQKELSEESGITESTISRYVKGECMPSLKNIINLMITLDCTFDELVDVPDQIIR